MGVDMDMRHAVGVAMPMSMAHFFSVIVAMAMAIWTVAVPMPISWLAMETTACPSAVRRMRLQ